MIVSEACTINVLLALALALARVVSYDSIWCYKLWRHSMMTPEASSYDLNIFIVQATGLLFTKLLIIIHKIGVA